MKLKILSLIFIPFLHFNIIKTAQLKEKQEKAFAPDTSEKIKKALFAYGNKRMLNDFKNQAATYKNIGADASASNNKKKYIKNQVSNLRDKLLMYEDLSVAQEVVQLSFLHDYINDIIDNQDVSEQTKIYLDLFAQELQSYFMSLNILPEISKLQEETESQKELGSEKEAIVDGGLSDTLSAIGKDIFLRSAHLYEGLKTEEEKNAYIKKQIPAFMELMGISNFLPEEQDLILNMENLFREILPPQAQAYKEAFFKECYVWLESLQNPQ